MENPKHAEGSFEGSEKTRVIEDIMSWLGKRV
jgi:hypothetical protein